MPNKSITLTLVKILTPIVLFLTPLFFLPLTANFFTTPQQILIILVTLILLLGLTFDVLYYRHLPLGLSPIRLALIVFVGVIITGILANPEGRTEALSGQGSLLLALAGFSYFLSLTQKHSPIKSHSVLAFITGSFLLALHGLLQLTILHSSTFIPSYMQDRGFTPTGSPLITASLLVMGAAVAFSAMSTYSSSLKKYYAIVAGTCSVITAIAYLSLMLPGGYLAPTLLPLAASWNIMLDAFKNTHNLIFGVGLANFSLLFTSVKPLFLNGTPLWNILPSTASTELFQWLTTTGLLGTSAFLYLIVSGLRQIAQSKSSLTPLSLVFTLSVITLLITPGSVPVYLLFFASLGLISSAGSENILIQKSASFILALTLLTTVGYSGFHLVRLARAEYHMRQARVALASSDARTVYESNLQAVQLIPTMTNYRLSYSQVNLSLAASLSQKEDLSDEEKAKINQLITQSIREAKASTSLRPHDARTWQNLGSIYANLLTVSEGANQFALDAYAQAVALDAGNPSLRLEFGNLLVQLAAGTKEESQKAIYLNRASSEFQTTIQLKPDYANAYYNLAKLLESVGDYSNAYLAMQKAVSLLEPTSPDLTRANTELATIKSKVPSPSPSPSASPTPIPSVDQ